MIADFLREMTENYALLGYYVARSGNLWPTFRDKLSVPSSGISKPKREPVPTYRRAIWRHRLAQIDVHSCVNRISVSVTDTLNWDCACTNDFPFTVEHLDVSKHRTIAQETIGLKKGHNFGWKAFWDSNPDRSCLQ